MNIKIQLPKRWLEMAKQWKEENPDDPDALGPTRCVLNEHGRYVPNEELQQEMYDAIHAGRRKTPPLTGTYRKLEDLSWGVRVLHFDDDLKDRLVSARNKQTGEKRILRVKKVLKTYEQPSGMIECICSVYRRR